MTTTATLIVHPNRTGPTEPVGGRWAIHVTDGPGIDATDLSTVANAGWSPTMEAAAVEGAAHLATVARVFLLAGLELAELHVTGTIDYHPPQE